MYEQNSILPEHYEHLAETFEHITDLIDQNKVSESIAILIKLHYADLADFLDSTNYEIHKIIIPILINDIKPETLIWISDDTKHSIIDIAGIKKISLLLDQLATENVIEVIETISEDLKTQIIANFSDDKKQQIIEGFNYPENTVGRILERTFISFQEHWTTGQAIDYIRRSHKQHDFHAAIIVDSRFRPIGNILISTLLKHSRNTMLNKIMNHEFMVAETSTQLNDIAFIFKKYALTIVPVVSKNGKLIGSVSIDNMIYIIEQQTEKDIMQLGGVNPKDISLNIFDTAKNRFPWLFINLITAFLTSAIIDQFSATIEKLIALAIIMPIVASLGGNAGTQTMTVTVRALANKDINRTNLVNVILKETLVCGLNGIVFAFISFAISWLIFSNSELSMIFGIAVFINFIIAGLFGALIPAALHEMNIDPATSAGVFLTTMTDAFGFFIFLILAYFLLV